MADFHRGEGPSFERIGPLSEYPFSPSFLSLDISFLSFSAFLWAHRSSNSSPHWATRLLLCRFRPQQQAGTIPRSVGSPARPSPTRRTSSRAERDGARGRGAPPGHDDLAPHGWCSWPEWRSQRIGGGGARGSCGRPNSIAG